MEDSKVTFPTDTSIGKKIPTVIEASDGDPVDLSTGLYILRDNDLIVPGSLPIVLQRTYRNRDNVSRAFGIGTSHPYNIYLVGDGTSFTYADLILADGGRIHYERISLGKSYFNAIYEHTATPTEFYKSRLSWNGSGWEIRLQDGSLYVFRACGEKSVCGLIRHRDQFGDVLQITRDATGNVVDIFTSFSNGITLSHDSNNRIIRARTAWGRVIKNRVMEKIDYEYDSRRHLVKVKKLYMDLLGPIRSIIRRLQKIPFPKENWRRETTKEYSYDDSGQMVTIKEPGILIRNQYDEGGRVIKQILTDGSTFEFSYALNEDGKIEQTDVRRPDGSLRSVTFNSDGYTISDTYLKGSSRQFTIVHNRVPGNNRVIDLTITCTSHGEKISVTAPVSADDPEDDVKERLLSSYWFICLTPKTKNARIPVDQLS
jgi:YD repeat-containing protein